MKRSYFLGLILTLLFLTSNSVYAGEENEYTLTVSATGNGSASYGGFDIRNNYIEFTLQKGASATITFSPDEGSRIKKVIVNEVDVTSTIFNNQYVISSLSSNTSVDVEFEEYKGTIYTLTIKATGNGSAIYGDNTIRMTSCAYSLLEGSSVTIYFNPDEGNKVKSVKVITSNSITSSTFKEYTINSISTNTTIEVEFEETDSKLYTLSIKSTGNGSVKYGEITITNTTSDFSLNAGDTAKVSFNADDGYKIKSLKVIFNGTTYSFSNQKEYTIKGISANTLIDVEFEAINPDEYLLTIKADGKGSAIFGEDSIRNTTLEYTLKKGASATIKFSPDEGNKTKSVVIQKGGNKLSSIWSEYTLKDIASNINVEVEFWEILEAFTNNKVNYTVISQDKRTVSVASGDYGVCLNVPASFSAYDREWKVVGIDEGALKDATKLAAVIWNPYTEFTESVSNPNLLLYVKSADYAPSDVKNVIVNNKAKNITLIDAASGNNFYCPQEFTAEQISYEHNYSMKTGYNTCQGWESIVLPFDVAVVTNNSGTELVAYPLWNRGDSKRPFWLYSMNEDGWKSEAAIKANTPYIISMPNNANYDATYNQSGNIVFSASNVKVKSSDNMSNSKHGHRNLVPNYQNNGSSSEIYALNVNTLWDKNTENDIAEGSAFIRGLRQVRPFEAYMTIDSGGSNTRSISIFGDGDATGIMDIPASGEKENVKVYSLSGALIKQGKRDDVINSLPKGIYIINKKKVVVR